MLHDKRTWCVADVSSAEELAERLTEHSWCLCVAFRLQGAAGSFLFLNDSTSEDGAVEFAIVREGTDGRGRCIQVESTTFGWCDEPKALRYIRQAVDEGEKGTETPVEPRLQSPDEHVTCPHCA